MKTWPLFVGIIVILALVCSPAAAISKADLMARYKDQTTEPYVYAYDNGTFVSRTGEVVHYNHDSTKSLESLSDWHTWITLDKQSFLQRQ